MDLTASMDGRVWFQGVEAPSFENSGTDTPYNYVQPLSTLFKSPGPIDQNYAGPWHYAIWNAVQDNTDPLPPSSPTPLGVISQPYLGYFSPAQCILFDDKRQALYAVMSIRSPDYSQNMRIFFIISRDSGQTWSAPIDISTTDFANRGFPSMALDEVTGNLVFGWYDGRHDKSYQSVEYYGAVLEAKKLDKLVKSIPVSYTFFTLPSAAG
jgi:hypothetical protein